MVDFKTALYKDSHIIERNKAEFRAEGFNIFNHTDFSGLQSKVPAGSYGQGTSALDTRILPALPVLRARAWPKPSQRANPGNVVTFVRMTR